MTIALRLMNVRVTLGHTVVVDNVSATFAERSLSVVIGRSGAGKSVLWKAVAGLLPRSGGDVVVTATPLVFVHQDPALLEDRTTLDNVTFAAMAHRLDSATTLERLREVCDALGLDPLLDVPARLLTPAQARRVALARALMLRPGVLVVDEPTTGLDPIEADDVGEALIRVADEATLIVITHHPRTIARLRQTPRCRTWRVDAGTLRLLDEAVA